MNKIRAQWRRLYLELSPLAYCHSWRTRFHCSVFSRPRDALVKSDNMGLGPSVTPASRFGPNPKTINATNRPRNVEVNPVGLRVISDEINDFMKFRSPRVLQKGHCRYDIDSCQVERLRRDTATFSGTMPCRLRQIPQSNTRTWSNRDHCVSIRSVGIAPLPVSLDDSHWPMLALGATVVRAVACA